jgi:DNA-binding CsgD family transcriptional regulator
MKILKSDFFYGIARGVMMQKGMDYLRRIRALLVFLRTGSPSLDDILRFIALETINEFGVISLQLHVVFPNGTIHIPSSYGHNNSTIAEIPVRLISTDTPFNAFLRADEIGECGDFDEFVFAGSDYPKRLWPQGFEYSFVWPIPGVGTLGTFCSRTNDLTLEKQEFLLVIGSILAFELNVIRKGQPLSGEIMEAPQRAPYSLTLRQWEILAGIRSGKTNAQIAEYLGFSESLIRQETVQIYRKLGVSGRKEIQIRNIGSDLEPAND